MGRAARWFNRLLTSRFSRLMMGSFSRLVTSRFSRVANRFPVTSGLVATSHPTWR